MKFFLPILLCLAVQAFSQDCSFSLRGKVIDRHDNSILKAASVRVYGTQRELLTDNQGRFNIDNLCTETVELEISHPSCKTQFIKVLVLSSNTQTFYLEHHIEALNEVEVFSNKEQVIQENTIGRETIENKISENFADMLSNMNGVSTLRTGNSISKPMIQGFYGSRVLTNNQGVKMQDMEWGDEHAPNIATSSVDKVTVIHGALSLKYGADASGGVIVMTPKKPTFKHSLNIQSISAYQTNGRGYLISKKIDKNHANGSFYGLQLEYQRSGDNKNPLGYLSNTGREQQSIAIPFGIHKAHFGVNGYISLFKTNIGILRNAHIGNVNDLINQINNTDPSTTDQFKYQIDNPRQNVQHFLAKLALYYRIEKLGKIEVQYDFQENHRQEFDLRLGERNKIPSIDLNLKTHHFLSNLQLDLPQKYDVEFGAEYTYQDHFPNPITNVKRLIPDYISHHIGTYITGAYSPNNQWEFSASGRLDYLSIQADKFYKWSRWKSLGYDELYPSFEREITNTQILTAPKISFPSKSAAISSKYANNNAILNIHFKYIERAPNPAELFSEGLHHSAARIEIGSLNLKVEQALKTSVQFQFENDQRSIFISPFYNRINNYMVLLPSGVEFTLRGAFPVWEYQQTNAQLTGFDFEWKELFNKQWSFSQKLSMVKAKDLENSTAFPNIPPVHWTQKIDKSWGLKNPFTIELNGQYVFRQNEVPENLSIFNPNTGENTVLDLNGAPPDYFLLGTALSYRFKDQKNTAYEIRLSGQNLLNNNYQNYLNRLRYFMNETGRNISFQLKINL